MYKENKALAAVVPIRQSKPTQICLEIAVRMEAPISHWQKAISDINAMAQFLPIALYIIWAIGLPNLESRIADTSGPIHEAMTIQMKKPRMKHAETDPIIPIGTPWDAFLASSDI
ncbi:hypothetical protein OGATHE_005142 [Ogataea polymorpha]|uniref:Uncharacterized protein n=1 Tax=Ogataea polymorpha TaxID=460523 RepID=A0A9P8NW29_9ASCO|nr:hypothetical protein OGATHE_005142 [Ogataea polymorpha]